MNDEIWIRIVEHGMHQDHSRMSLSHSTACAVPSVSDSEIPKNYELTAGLTDFPISVERSYPVVPVSAGSPHLPGPETDPLPLCCRPLRKQPVWRRCSCGFRRFRHMGWR